MSTRAPVPCNRLKESKLFRSYSTCRNFFMFFWGMLGSLVLSHSLYSLAPVIDPGRPGTTITFQENETHAVTWIDVTDPDGHKIQFIEVSGKDADRFNVEFAGGDIYEIQFISPPTSVP